LLQLKLQQSYCLPVLQYASSALYFSKSEIRILNVCWNNVYRKIFKYNQWESVNSVIDGFGYLNFSFLWYLSVFKFIKTLLTSSNVILRQTARLYCYSQQWQFIKSEFNVDEHCPVYIITKAVYDKFHDISNNL
jgi:hypothetical protein